MRVVVGPVSNQSAKAWLAYAHTVLDEIARDRPDECFASPDVVRTFEQYVKQWDAVCVSAGDQPFRWSGDVPDEQAEYHAHAFHQTVNFLAVRAAATGGRRSPVEADEFYTVLVAAVIAALGQGPSATAEFAEHLGAFWPGPISA